MDGLPGAEFSSRVCGRSETVDYARCWETKRRILLDAFANTAADQTALDAFVTAGGAALRHFATFDAIAETQPSSHWQRWPEPLQHPDDPAVAAFAAVHAVQVRFHCFLQYLADKQFPPSADAARDRRVIFYRDLAVGSAPDGAEAWSRQDALMQGVSIGAPPDQFSKSPTARSTLPPPDPFAITREGSAGFSALLATNMRHAGALRIDHVMGLERLFVVPDGASARDNTYFRIPARTCSACSRWRASAQMPGCRRGPWHRSRRAARGARGGERAVVPGMWLRARRRRVPRARALARARGRVRLHARSADARGLVDGRRHRRTPVPGAA